MNALTADMVLMVVADTNVTTNQGAIGVLVRQVSIWKATTKRVQVEHQT